MIKASETNIEARTFPAGRSSRNLVGGRSPVKAHSFNLGRVRLQPNGGQVPWHNHDQEEVYYILSGNGEMCVGDSIDSVSGGNVVYIESNAFHQLTNTADSELEFIYCYGPAGDVSHWRQELEGTLPVAGVDVPSLPAGATKQFVSSG